MGETIMRLFHIIFGLLMCLLSLAKASQSDTRSHPAGCRSMTVIRKLDASNSRRRMPQTKYGGFTKRSRSPGYGATGSYAKHRNCKADSSYVNDLKKLRDNARDDANAARKKNGSNKSTVRLRHLPSQ